MKMVNKQEIEKAIEILMDIQSDWEDGEEYEAFNLAISALEQQLNGGWIPCKSKLPDKVHMKYLVTMKHKHFNEYCIDCRNLYSDYQFEFENNFERHNWDVVAWQPLPEPYKED